MMILSWMKSVYQHFTPLEVTGWCQTFPRK